MTTALITTCDRCDKQLATKSAPAKPAPAKPANLQVVAYTSSSGVTPAPKQYDFCHQCASAFTNWLGSGRDQPASDA